MQASLSDLLVPSVDVIEAAGGGRAFMNLGGHPLFLSQRDTLLNDSIQGGDNQVRFSHLNQGITFFSVHFFFSWGRLAWPRYAGSARLPLKHS